MKNCALNSGNLRSNGWFYLMLVTLVNVVFGQYAMANTLTWTGAASSDWMNSTNWSPAQVPGATDTAIINSGNVTFSTNTQFAVLTFNGGTVYGSLTVPANTVFNWSGGRFGTGSSLTVASNALANFYGGNQKELGGVFTNAGRVVWSGGGFNMLNDNGSWQGRVINLGIWEMQDDLWLGQYWGNDAAYFQNNGIFRKTAGPNTGAISLPFMNEFGSIEIQSGVLRYDHGTDLKGSFFTWSGSGIQFSSGTFTCWPNMHLSGPGWYRLTGGYLAGLPDYYPNLQLNGGTVSLSPNYQTNGAISQFDLNGATLSGNYRVTGTFNFYGGYVAGATTVGSNAVCNWYSGRFAEGSSITIETNAVLNLINGGQKELGGALTNAGQVVWTGGNLYLLNNASSFHGIVENLAGGVWDIRGDFWLGQYWYNDNCYFRNRGLLKKSSGTGTCTFDMVLINEGTLEQCSGVLGFGRDLSLTDGAVIFGLGANGNGRLNVPVTATLGGSVGVEFLNGFLPGTNQSFQVMTFGANSGSFTNSVIKTGFGRYFTPVYNSTSISLQAWPTNGVNSAPVWTAIPNYTISEGSTLQFTNTVTDPDGNQVLFKLVSGPTGAAVGLTNGVFTWTPTEAQGPSTNTVTLSILDNGSPSMMVTQAFTVIVNEVNVSPTLPAIAPQWVGVGGKLTVTNTASDADPNAVLTYQLAGGPSDATISTNGIITWAPTNSGSFQITTRVTDNGTPALIATNTFVVNVLSKPTPPSGLVSWWTGDGTTADKQALNDGVLSGSASYVDGLFGKAFYFTGGYLSVLHSASLSFGATNAVSVELWAKRTQGGYPVYYFGKRVGCGAFNYQSPSDEYSAGTWYDAPVGEWRHYVWVFTGTEMLGYINGALVYRTQMGLGAENTAALFIGNSGTCGQPFVGVMDEVRIYNRALSGNEVGGLFGGQNLGAPVLSQQLQDVQVAAGSQIALNVSAFGTGPLTYQWRRNGTALVGQTAAALTLSNATTNQSGVYDVVVSNSLGAVTSRSASVLVIAAPQITSQPSAQVTSVGSTVNFTVVATGTPTPALNFQWRKDGVALPGQTSATLTLSNVQTNDAGNYDVLVYNLVGSAASSTAKLTVAAPLVWTGSVSRDWTNPANWNPARVPTASDTAVINSGNITIATNAQFQTLTFNGGYLSGPIVVVSKAVMNWTGGRLDQGSSLVVLSNGFVNLSGNNQKELGGAITNYGRIAWSGGSFYVMNDGGGWRGTVTNVGTFEMQGDLWMGQWWDNSIGVVGNSGNFVKSAGTGVGVLSLPLINSGRAEAQTGTLRLDRGCQLNAPIYAASGAVIAFNGGTVAYVPGVLKGAGQYQLTGATFSGLEDDLSNLQLNSGSVNLSPTFQTNGAIVQFDMTGASLNGSNRVVGTFSMSGGWVNGPLTIAPNGTFTMNGGSVNGPLVVSSNAVFNWYGGRFEQGSSLRVDRGGVVNLLGSSEKQMGGVMTNAGWVVWSGGSFTIMNDGGNWKGVAVNLGVWEMQGDLWLGAYWGNDVAYFQNAGVFRKGLGTGTGVINIPFMNTFGTLEVLGGTLRYDHGQYLDGVYVAGPGTMVQFGNGTFTYAGQVQFTGAGVYRLTGGTLNGLDDYVPDLQITGGTVNLSPTFQTNGAISRLDLSGAVLNGSNNVSGTLNMSGGSINGPLTVLPNGVVGLDGVTIYGPMIVSSNAVLNWYGGRFVSTLTVQSNGVVNMIGGNQKEFGNLMVNKGQVNWQGGSISVLNENSSWHGAISNWGTWEMRGDLGLYSYWGNDFAVFYNSGVFRKASGTGTGYVSLPFSQGGVLESLSGVINFNRSTDLSGGNSVVFGLGASGAGRLQISSTATLGGNLGVRLLDGFVPGTNQTFSVMTFGSSSGTFNPTNLNVGFGCVLSPVYASTALTLQTAPTNGVNHVPTWTAIPGYAVNEGSTLTFTNIVSDSDGNQVFFKLLTGPTGAAVGLTNGVFTWTPTEGQGPSTNTVTLRIFDNGAPSMAATQSFSLVVNEVNVAPVLPTIPAQWVGVGGTLTVVNTASDSDLPANTLTYSLLSSPSGVAITNNGIITWSPTNTGTYQITTRVTDNGTPALSATNTFVVNVVSRTTPAAGLVSWWTGDGTTADKMAANDGALAGSAGYADGLFGKAFNFTGGYLSVLHSDSLSFGSGEAISVEMWAKRTQGGYPIYYFGKRINCEGANYQSPSDIYGGGSLYDAPVGEWRHYVWTFTGSEMLGYINGALVYRAERGLGPENTASLLIGSSGTCNQPFVGLMQDVRIYNRALAGTEVSALYGAQSFGAPVISQQPTDQQVTVGSKVSLNVSAYGAGPMHYQWRCNGVELPGQTSSNLVFNSVSLGQGGIYDVVISNTLGVVTSRSAGLLVLQPPQITTQPRNQASAVGSIATFTVVATGTPTPALNYQWRKDGVNLPGQMSPVLTLNNVQTNDAGNYDVVIYNLAGVVSSDVVKLTVSLPVVWTGAVSRDWNTPGNWNPARVPGPADTAVVNSGSVTMTTDAQFQTLSFLGGYISGPIVIVPDAVMNWYGGRLEQGASLLVMSNGFVNLGGNNQKELGGALTNYGRVLWSGGSLYVMNDGGGWRGTVTNIGNWEIKGDLTLGQWWDNSIGVFGNGGSLVKSSGTGTAVLQLPLLNDGSVEVQSGTLRLDRGARLNGTLTADASTVIAFNGGNFAYAPGVLRGAGQFQLTGGTLTGLDDDLPNLQLTGGSVSLSPTFQTNGVIVQFDMNGASLSGSNRVVGAFNMSGGSVNGPLTIAPNGTFTLNGGSMNGPLVVSSNAVFNWYGGRFEQASSLKVEQGGLMNLLGGGEKQMGGPLTNAGTVAWSGGSFTVMNDGGGWKGVVVNQGTWEMQADLWLGSYWGNDIATFQNLGVFRKSAGTGTGAINIPFINTQGTLEVQSGTLRFDHGQTLDGLYVAGAGTVIQFSGGTFTYGSQTRLSGGGVYQLTGGTLNGLDNNLPNLQLVGGTVNLSPTFQTNGTITRLDLNGTTLSGSNTVVGILNMSGGSISGPLTVAPNGVASLSGPTMYGPVVVSSNAVLNWYSGRMVNTLLVQSNGLLNMLSGNQKEIGNVMDNEGQVIWKDGGFTVLCDNGSWRGVVTNNGTWELQGDLWFGQYWGNDAAVFYNNGLFRKTGGTGSAAVSMPFINGSGRFEIQSGTMRFDHGETLDGLFVTAPGAAINFNSGTFVYTSKTQLTGAGAYQLTGGTLQNLNDYVPNLRLLGGTVALSPTYQTNGTIVRLDLDGSTLVGSNAVSGILNFNSGYISGPLVVGANGQLNWSSGRFAVGSSLSVRTNGQANLMTGATKELGGGLTNAGWVVWSGGTLNLLNDAGDWKGGIENLGIWEVRGDFWMGQYWANNYAYFHNVGDLRKVSGSGTATIDTLYYNQGLIEQLSGTLAFGRNFSLTDGTAVFGLTSGSDYGRISVNGMATLAGHLVVRLMDGFVPDVNQSFAIMTFNANSGTFTNYDGLNVGFGRYLTPAYSANALTLQTYATNGINHAPVWAAIPNFTVIKGVTLTYTNIVTDPDNDTVLFKMVSAPTGATVNLTNGVFTWTPTETQGPSTNTLTMRIFDSGSPSMGSTQSFTVIVRESPHPDLVVSNLNVTPAVIKSGTALTVHWQDANLGDTNLAQSFADHVVIRNTASGQKLVDTTVAYDVPASGTIAIGAAATRSLDFRMPDSTNAVGTFAVEVTADVNGQIAELNTLGTGESNNSATNTITSTLAPYPDLTVTNLNVLPAVLQSGVNMTIRWQDTNMGSGVVTQSFAERVVVRNLTTSQTLLDTVSYYNISANGPITNGTPKDRSVAFKLPDSTNVVGNLQITITADNDNQVFECALGYDAEANNALSITNACALAPYPDLQVTNLTVTPAAPLTASDITVNWRLVNNGNAAVSAPFWERIVLRNLTTGKVLASPTLYYDTAVATNGAITAGGVRNQQTVFHLPDGINGAGTIAVEVTADYYGEVLELNLAGTAESNNSTTNTFTSSLKPYPDLVISHLNVQPASIRSGMDITINWQDDNSGTADVTQPFYDRVVIRNPAGNQVLLDTLAYYDNSVAGPVVAGGSKLRSIPFHLPDSTNAVGKLEITVTADRYDQIFECVLGIDAEANNSTSITNISTLSAYPDLQVAALSVSPASPVSGSGITINWRTTNSGTAVVNGSFSDRIVVRNLSTGEVLGNSLLAYDATANGLIGINDARNRQFVFHLPDGASGAGNLSVEVTADCLGQITEITGSGDAEGNNSATNNLVSTLAAYPDLVVQNITNPGTGASASPVTISWTVRNNGPTPATGVWTEQVFLSTDGSIGNAQLLNTFIYTNSLASGQAVSRSQAVSLPMFGAGQRWFVVVVDAGNDVFETNELDNASIGASPITIPRSATLTLSPASIYEGGTTTAKLARNGDFTNAVTFALSSGNTNRLIVPASVTLGVGQQSANVSLSAVQNGLVDGDEVVPVVAVASGYTTASNSVTVMDDDVPVLSLTVSPSTVVESAGSHAGVGTVVRNTATNTDLVVSIISSDTSRIVAPATITIAAGERTNWFFFSTVNNNVPNAPALVSLSAVAQGFVSGSGSVTVTDDDVPSVTLELQDAAVTEGAPNPATQLTITRSPVTSARARFSLQSTMSSMISVPYSATIAANEASVTVPVTVGNNNWVDGRRTVQLIITALDDVLGAPIPGAIVTTNIVVEDDDGPTLTVNLAATVISETGATTGTVSRNTATTSDLEVFLTSSAATNLIVPESVTIKAGQSSATFDVTGVSDNVAAGNKHVTVSASAPGFNSGSGTLTVSDVDLPDLRPVAILTTNRAITGAAVPIRFVVTNTGLSDASDYWIDRVYLANSTAGDGLQYVGQASHLGGLVLGDSYTNTVAAFLPQVAGDYYIMVAVNDNSAIDETSTRNNRLLSTNPITVGPAYRATIAANIHTAVAGTAIPLHGSAWNTADNSPAANVRVTVRAIIKGTRRVFDAWTDANGQINTVYQPLPTEAGQLSLAADHPGVSADTIQDSVKIYGMHFGSFDLTQRLYPNVAATNTVDLSNLGDLPLTGLHARFEALPSFVIGTATITNSLDDSGTVQVTYSLVATNVVNATVRARLRVDSTEGASAYVPITINIQPLTTTLVSTPGVVDLGVVRGDQKVVQLDVGNIGGIESGPIQVQVPNLSWVGLSSPSNLPSITPGQNTRITLVLTPPSSTPLTRYDTSLYLAGQNGNLNVPLRLRTLSAAHGDLKVEVLDDYTYYVDGAPRVTNATVRLSDPYTGDVVVDGNTGTNGFVLFTNIAEGSYQMRVTADKHNTYASPVDVVAGVETDKSVFIDRQTVTYHWTVTPTTIQDQYQVVLEPVFETEVPIPVVTLDNPSISPLVVAGGEGQIELHLSNHGLIAAERVTIVPPQSDRYEITPLVPVIDVLPAMSSITVPVSIKDKSSPAYKLRKGIKSSLDVPSCGKTFTGCDAVPEIGVKWSWICGDDRRWHGLQADLEFTCVDTNCWENIKNFLEEKLKENAEKVLKGGVVNVRELPADYACEIINIIAICSGITDQCALSALKAACGIATKDLGTAASGATGLAGCFCPKLPSLPTISSPPPGEPDPIPNYVVTINPGPGGPSSPIVDPIGWDYQGADCDPGLHPINLKNRQSAATQAGGVCARVRLRLEQQVALTRNAFLGSLEIDNEDATVPLTGVQVILDIRDELNNSANDKFFVGAPELSVLSAVDGSGVLNPSSTGSAKFTFIPTHEAAPDAPKVYRFGGTLIYNTGGNRVEVPLAPEALSVMPDPVLHLDYFLQRDVFADDPFTPEVEPSEPFALGLLVRNTGKGKAADFRITTGQPKIVENQKGLLIDFKITGTQVGSQPITPSLAIRFGDIDAGKAEVAGFWMVSTLQGKFIDYTASFKHVDSLGGQQTSLIDDVTMHSLTHIVRANRTGDDDKIDFLVDDVPDANNTPDTLYFSDGSQSPVQVASSVTTDGGASLQHLAVHLNGTMPAGWTYLKAADPGPNYRLYRVVRSDGKEILVGTNAWTTDRSFPSALAGAVRENLFHLLDYNSTGSYTLYYRINDDVPPTVVSVGDGVGANQTAPLSSIDVVFSETIDLSTLSYSDLTLTVNGGANLINSSVTITNVGTNVYRISGLAPLTGTDGNYQLTVLGAGVQDFGGNPASNNGVFNWAKSTTAPVVVSITKPSPDPRNSAITSLDVAFSFAVDPATFTIAGLSLTRDGSANLITSDVVIAQLTTNTFRVSGLTGLTATEGRYTFTVLGSSIKGVDGVAGKGSLSQTWAVLTAGPVLTRLEAPNTNPRNIVVQTLDVTFARAIDPATFDWHDLSLTRDGGLNLISSDVKVTRLTDTSYRLSNFSWVQGQAGVYLLTVSASGVQDLAGNSGSGSLSQSWTLDLTKPLAPTNLVVNPDTGMSTNDAVTRSNVVTLAGSVMESNLTVRVYDDTLGADLGTATVTGTNFTMALTFNSAGAHNLRTYAADLAGNISDNALLNVFIDQSVPAAAMDAISPNPRTNGIASIAIRFSEVINPATFNWAHLVLTRDAATNNLINATNVILTTTSSNVVTVTGLMPLTTPLGSYQLVVDMRGVEDRAGNVGVTLATNAWVCYKPNSAPVVEAVSDKVVNELETLNFFINASDVDQPRDILTFSFVGKVPLGASLDTASGLFSWTPTERQGPSTNEFVVTVTDNGIPSMSNSVVFTVVVKEVNTPPVIRAVSNQVAYALTPLVVTNVVTDSDIPANHITFTLGHGAPSGAQISSSGRFLWTPAIWQIPSTNVITIIATDDGVPAMSGTNKFTIVVGDFASLALGTALVPAGQATNLPVTFYTSSRVTNVNFTVRAPASRLSNLTFAPDSSANVSVRSSVLAADVTQFILETSAGKFLNGTQTVGRLQFTAVPDQHSAFIPIPVQEVIAIQGNGQIVPKTIGAGGRVVVVDKEFLLEAIGQTNQSCNLMLYGPFGGRYRLDTSSQLEAPNWVPWKSGTLNDLALPISPMSTTNRALFIRVVPQP